MSGHDFPFQLEHPNNTSTGTGSRKLSTLFQGLALESYLPSLVRAPRNHQQSNLSLTPPFRLHPPLGWSPDGEPSVAGLTNALAMRGCSRNDDGDSGELSTLSTFHPKSFSCISQTSQKRRDDYRNLQVLVLLFYLSR